MTISLVKLSESVNGKGIKVVGTATGSATTIHTAVNTADILDEMFIEVTNNHTSTVNLTLEFGGVASPDNLIQLAVPAKSGLLRVIAGLPLDGGVLIKAFASVANVISVYGYALRTDQS